MDILLSEMNVWHWVIIALILFGIEMMTGTFDLLMISVAAAATAVFAWMAPGAIGGWQGQLVFFAIAATGLFIFGRTVLAGMRENVEEHPTLNKRMSGLEGRRGIATKDFEAGVGQIKIGDTVWGAEAADGETISSGDAIVVSGARSTTAIVRRV